MKVYVAIEINDDNYRDMVELAHHKGQTFDELMTENNNEWCEISLGPQLDFQRFVQKHKARERKQVRNDRVQQAE